MGRSCKNLFLRLTVTIDAVPPTRYRYPMLRIIREDFEVQKKKKLQMPNFSVSKNGLLLLWSCFVSENWLEWWFPVLDNAKISREAFNGEIPELSWGEDFQKFLYSLVGKKFQLHEQRSTDFDHLWWMTILMKKGQTGEILGLLAFFYQIQPMMSTKVFVLRKKPNRYRWWWNFYFIHASINL